MDEESFLEELEKELETLFLGKVKTKKIKKEIEYYISKRTLDWVQILEKEQPSISQVKIKMELEI